VRLGKRTYLIDALAIAVAVIIGALSGIWPGVWAGILTALAGLGSVIVWEFSSDSRKNDRERAELRGNWPWRFRQDPVGTAIVEGSRSRIRLALPLGQEQRGGLGRLCGAGGNPNHR
jgi:uncharacterized protein (DUF58 family)